MAVTQWYDALGRVTQTQDAAGQQTAYLFDKLGQLTRSTEDSGGGGVARYTDRAYDRAGRMTRLTGYPVDATNAQNTDYAYNKASVQTRATYPDDSPGSSRGYVVYSYDAALRLTRINHQDDTNTDVVYDSMGRRLTITKGEEIDSFAYAATGQVTLAKRGWIAALRSYDGLGRLTRETQQNGRDRNVDYAYDKGGNVLTLTYPFSGAVQTSYDALGRALTVKRNGSQLASYTYTGARPKSQTFETGANDVTLNMTYDGVARLTRMAYSQTGNTSLPDFSYQFDSASDITRKTFNNQSGANEDYAYDTLNRLTRTTFGQRASTPYKGYIYDDLGNHLTQDDNGTTTAGLFNAVNEQTKRAANDVLYDARGNLTKDDSGKAYFYDRQNMLTCVEDAQGNLVMRYAYDAFNRLIERDCNWAYAMQYDYDGWRRLEECPSDDPGAHRCFVWPPGTAGYIDDLICLVNGPAQYQNNITYFACRNHNFSVTAMLTTAGAVVERYDYNPYGERIVLDPDYAADADGLSDLMNPVGFQGLFHDDETGLIYVRNRYLKPTLGRWMTRDPAGYPNGCNFYAGYFAMWGTWDPFGLSPGDYEAAKAGGYSDEEIQAAQSRGLNPWDPAWARIQEEQQQRQAAAKRAAEEKAKQAAEGKCKQWTIGQWKAGLKCRKPKKNPPLVAINGCGPDWLVGYIPVALRNNPSSALGGFSVDFTGACNFHDRCYQSCGIDKSKCDRWFGERMRAACAEKSYDELFKLGTVLSSGRLIRVNQQYASCLAAAALYEGLVSTLGDDSYWTSQWEQCDCVDCAKKKK